MGLVSALPLAMAAVALYVGLWHWRVYQRGGRQREHLSFALLCFGVALYDVGSAGAYSLGGTPAGEPWQRLQNVAIGVIGPALAWFVLVYSRRGWNRTARALTAYYCVHVVVTLALWNDWVLTSALRVTRVSLPWGGAIVYQELRHGALLRISSAVHLVCILLVLAWTADYWRRATAEEAPRARRLAAGLGVFLCGALNDLAVTNDVYSSVYLMEYAYLALVLVMTQGLSEGVLEMARTRGELRQSLARLQRIFDSVEEVYIESSLDGTILEISPSAQRWVGTGVDLRGRSSWDFYASAEDRRRLLDTLRREGRVRDFEATVRLPDGRTSACASNVALVTDEATGEQRIVGSLRDITEQKRAEAERQRLEERMQQAQKLEGLGLLAGGIAHDFNNLLTGILGFVELALLQLQPDHEARPRVEAIRPIARRATELCRQMLAYSGRARFDVAPLDLSALVRGMAELLRISAAKSIVLEYELAEDLPAVVADATQLRQILLNLTLNAAEAIEGGGSVSIKTRLIRCTESELVSGYLSGELPAGDYVALEVGDSGCGMDAGTLKRLFDPFFTTKFSGRGLGLAAVLGIVRAHRGTIHVESAVGQGSLFRVLLPSARATAATPSAPEPPSAWRGRGHVLLVDDEPWVREVAGEMLQHLGFGVTLASGGRQALELFAARPDGFTLAIVDLTMPDRSGLEVVRELLRIRPGTRVLLASGYSEEEGVELLADKGALGFLAKPFTLETLRLTIRDALEQAGHARQDGRRRGDEGTGVARRDPPG